MFYVWHDRMPKVYVVVMIQELLVKPSNSVTEIINVYRSGPMVNITVFLVLVSRIEQYANCNVTRTFRKS